MKKRGMLLLTLSIILATSLVFAAHVITISDGSSSFDFNEDTTSLYNISVNNTDTLAGANISEVNITLPSAFNFTFDTNDTSVGTHTFTNTSTVLSWLNDGLVMNLTVNNFWFNATASPGHYNITVDTTNSSGTSSTNLSVTINETTPIISYASPSEVDGANLSQDYIEMNITADSNSSIDTITVRLYNSSDDQINSSTSSTSPLYINFSNLSEGTYKVNATVNNSLGNENSASTRTILLDTTLPSVAASENSDTQTSLNISITVTESGSGINGACTTDRSGASVSGTGNSQEISESSLSCGTSYTYEITCIDYAGNSGSVNESFSTDGCSSSSSSGGGSSSSISKKIYSLTEEQFAEGFTRELEKDDGFKFEIDNEDHFATVEKVETDEVSFLVNSTPITFILKSGENKRVDVDDSGFYDIKITLESISGNKANVTIIKNNEKVSAEDLAADTGTTDTTNGTIDLTNETIPTNTTAGGAEEEKGKSAGKVLLTIFIIIIIIFIVLGFFFYRRKKRRMEGY